MNVKVLLPEPPINSSMLETLLKVWPEPSETQTVPPEPMVKARLDVTAEKSRVSVPLESVTYRSPSRSRT